MNFGSRVNLYKSAWDTDPHDPHDTTRLQEGEGERAENAGLPANHGTLHLCHKPPDQKRPRERNIGRQLGASVERASKIAVRQRLHRKP